VPCVERWERDYEPQYLIVQVTSVCWCGSCLTNLEWKYPNVLPGLKLEARFHPMNFTLQLQLEVRLPKQLNSSLAS
jgi:hypothetical protein